MSTLHHFLPPVLANMLPGLEHIPFESYIGLPPLDIDLPASPAQPQDDHWKPPAATPPGTSRVAGGRGADVAAPAVSLTDILAGLAERLIGMPALAPLAPLVGCHVLVPAPALASAQPRATAPPGAPSLATYHCALRGTRRLVLRTISLPYRVPRFILRRLSLYYIALPQTASPTECAVAAPPPPVVRIEAFATQHPETAATDDDCDATTIGGEAPHIFRASPERPVSPHSDSAASPRAPTSPQPRAPLEPPTSPTPDPQAVLIDAQAVARRAGEFEDQAITACEDARDVVGHIAHARSQDEADTLALEVQDLMAVSAAAHDVVAICLGESYSLAALVDPAHAHAPAVAALVAAVEDSSDWAESCAAESIKLWSQALTAAAAWALRADPDPHPADRQLSSGTLYTLAEDACLKEEPDRIPHLYDALGHADRSADELAHGGTDGGAHGGARDSAHDGALHCIGFNSGYRGAPLPTLLEEGAA